MNTGRNAMDNHRYSSYISHLKQIIIQNDLVQINNFKYEESVKDLTSGAAKLNKNMIKVLNKGNFIEVFYHIFMTKI